MLFKRVIFRAKNYADSFPTIKIDLKKKTSIHHCAYNITVFRNLTYLRSCIVIRIFFIIYILECGFSSTNHDLLRLINSSSVEKPDLKIVLAVNTQ